MNTTTTAQKIAEFEAYKNEYGYELTNEELMRDFLVMVFDFDIEDAENLYGDKLTAVYNQYNQFLTPA